jgi:mRNA-degrading endonuclease RelE of RelBE toxin-antitoxin system
MENKIFFTEIKKIINEILKEEYPASFEMEYFKTLKSFNKRVEYCQKNLQRISSGSSRIVYKIDDEKVLKLAKNSKGLAQNEVEEQYSDDYLLEDILAKVFDYDENYLWVEMELAMPLTAKKFEQLNGYTFNSFCEALRYHYFLSKGKRLAEPLDMDKFWEDEFATMIFGYIENYDVPLGDLTRLSTYGIVKRNNQDTIVLVDYGLDNNTLKKYYS